MMQTLKAPEPHRVLLSSLSDSSRTESKAKVQELCSKRERIEEAIRLKSIEKLRALCAEEGGLLTCELRRQAWPIFLQIDAVNSDGDKQCTTSKKSPKKPCKPQKEQPLGYPLRKNKFYNQIKCDVDRSYAILEALCENKRRGGYKNRLMRLINSIFNEFDFLSYYQGYHDIASILLLVLESPTDDEDELPRKVLRVISLNFLRDHLISTLNGTLDHLYLLSCLLSYCNPYLLQKFRDMHMNAPIFALSWITTWFSHGVLDSIAREGLVISDETTLNDKKTKLSPQESKYKIPESKKSVIWSMLSNLFRLIDYVISQRPHVPIYLAAAVLRQGALENSDIDILSMSGLRTADNSSPNSVPSRGMNQENDYASLYTYISTLLDWRYLGDVERLIQESMALYANYPLNCIVRLYNHKTFYQVSSGKTTDEFHISHSASGRFFFLSESSCLYSFGEFINCKSSIYNNVYFNNFKKKTPSPSLFRLLHVLKKITLVPFKPFLLVFNSLRVDHAIPTHECPVPDPNWRPILAWEGSINFGIAHAKEFTNSFTRDLEAKKSYYPRHDHKPLTSPLKLPRRIIQLSKILGIAILISIIASIGSLISQKPSKLINFFTHHKKKLPV